MTDFDPKINTIKHNQHTDRKNTITLFFLKNSRVLLYLFFSQKQSCFIVSFLGSKMSVKRDFRSLQNFWVLGIGYWVLVHWVLRWLLVQKIRAPSAERRAPSKIEQAGCPETIWKKILEDKQYYRPWVQFDYCQDCRQ